MDTAHWPQGIGVVKSMEDSSSSRPILERRARPQKDQALNCPRCNSTTTKFCYYNNYSLSQPRYFCKTCRRYWTEGGSLRNVPVGGGSRKNNKRSNPSSPPSTSSAKKVALHDHLTPQNINFPHDHLQSSATHQNPKIHFQGQDLNLAYPPTDQDYDKFGEVPFSIDNKSHHQNPSSSTMTTSSHHFSAMELLKTGINASRGLTSFIPMAMPDSNNITMFSSGFSMQEFKPSAGGLSFSLDHGFVGSGYGCLQGVQETTNSHARLLFPTDDHHNLKQQIPSTTITTITTEFDQQNREEGDSGGGYWNGMLGGGSW